MSLLADLLFVFPVAGILTFLGILLAWLYQDVLPAWRNAMKIGPYELWLHKGASKNTKRRRRNLCDLTEMALDRREGSIMIERFIQGMKDPGFHMPSMEKQSFLEKLELAKDSSEYPFIEVGNFKLHILGIGASLSKPEVGITWLDKRISFPEGYVEGQSDGWRGRNYMRGRQFYFPKRVKNFLGKKKVRMSVLQLIPPLQDQKSEADTLEMLRKLTTDVAPIVPYLAESHVHEDKIRVLERQLTEATRQLDTAVQMGFSNVAGGVATRTGLEQLGFLLNLRMKPMKGALSPVVLIMGPLLGAIVFEYGFNQNPIFGVLLGSVLSVFPMLSR